MQIATALLAAGFGESAREEAKRGVDLDPKNADAWSTYAWILQHDAIGRRFGKGFDREGSLAAYRKAMEIDPKEWTHVANYAVLLEHNGNGERYESGADLESSAASYRMLKTLNKDQAPRYDSNLAFVLLYARKWAETIEFCASRPNDATLNSISLAAVAERDGAGVAIAEAQRAHSAESERSTALSNSANLLLRLRDYPLALELYRAAESGQEDPSQIRARIQTFESVRRFEAPQVPASDPQYAVQGFYLHLLNPNGKPEDMYLYSEADPDNRKIELQMFSHSARLLQEALTANNSATALEARDQILSNMQVAVEGDDTTGYRMRVRAIGDQLQTFYVVRRENGYRIIAADDEVGLIGREVLKALKNNDLKTAKHWLDWTREQITMNYGDDPLQGYLLPRFWTRGDDADPKQMRLAALSLLSMMRGVGEYIPELKALRAQASGEQAERLDLLIARAAWKAEDWQSLKEVAPRLFEAHPLSDSGLYLVQLAAIFGNAPEIGEKAVAQRLAKLPDDPPALRTSATLAASRGQFEQARKVLRRIIDANRAGIFDFNQYTWMALFSGQLPNEDVAMLQRAITANRNSGYAEIHTLACLYAEQGKTKDARELLLRAMAAGGLDEPNSAIWYGFGRIAEQYGLTEIASSFYKRVDKEEEYESATSTANLARRREQVIAGGKTAPETQTVHAE